jgi:serine/threonine-protein kinase
MGASPTSFGRYEVTDQIGAGAMGRVYRGFDPLVRRPVAIKTLKRELLLPSQADDALRRFRREAQAAGALSHPHIVNVFDVGDDYIVMELLDGTSLQALLRERGSLALDLTLTLLRPVADALDHAHAAGVIHRDIKPGNIMVLADGRPKLMDFGLARLESASATRPGEVFGSPSYMAPEQVAGDEITPRADVYALAVVAYECLAGRKPFEGANVAGVIHQVMYEPPPPPRRFAPALPERCDAVFARALAKDPALRYATAAALLDALQGSAGPLPAPGERTASGSWLTPPVPSDARRDAVSPQHAPGGVTHTYDELQAPLSQAQAPTSAARGMELRAGPPASRRLLPAVVVAALLGLGAAGLVAFWPRPAPTPAPAARLQVLTTPAGAAVFLDEREAGTAPLDLGPLAPGRHTVRVAREGFAPAQLRLEVADGVPLPPLSFVLQPLTATLRVSSRPAGAQVRLGDQVVGRTPIAGLPVPPGVYDVRVERPGYAPWTRTLSAAAGETQTVEARLERGVRARAPALSTGDLVPPGTPGVTEPARIAGASFGYPPSALAARLQGVVLGSMIVDEHGRPTKVRVVESAGEILDRAALEAARRWRYKPARKDGVNVKYPMPWRVEFKLE